MSFDAMSKNNYKNKLPQDFVLVPILSRVLRYQL